MNNTKNIGHLLPYGLTDVFCQHYFRRVLSSATASSFPSNYFVIWDKHRHEPDGLFQNYIRFFINLFFVLRTRIYCEDRKNFAYKINHPSQGWGVKYVMFLFQSLIFVATCIKNYIRFLISFYFASFACSKNCENRQKIARNFLATINS